jgi:hypothetical protein
LQERRYIPLETNRGCPYGCTFCDWGAATLSKITRFTLERVFGEIELAAKRRIHTVGFCDANFGVFPRDLEIIRFIVETSSKYGYPRDVGFTNAKSAKGTLLEIAKVLRDAGLNTAAQISMQTTDETVLKNVERANIKTTEYRKMIAFLHREDIPAASDMMVGLPGQTFETCKKDLQFFFDHKVIATIFATSVMPNAPMADPAYQERFRIVVDDDGMVESTYSFTREEYQRMFSLCLGYKLFVKLGLLKYVLYYTQIEHGLPAMDFVARWLEKSETEPDRYPLSSRIRREMIGGGYRGGKKDWLILGWMDEQAAFLFDDPEAFHREIRSFLEAEHGVSLDGPVAEAVFAANREVLPRKGRALPSEVQLSHDVPGYFSEIRALPSLSDIPDDHVPLAARPPAALSIKEAPACTSYGFIDFGLTRGELELSSNLRI